MRVVSTTTINLCKLCARAFGSQDLEKELEKVNGVVSALTEDQVTSWQDCPNLNETYLLMNEYAIHP